MFADQVKVMEYFVVNEHGADGAVLQRIPQSLGTDGWERYPGVLCINTKTGGFVGLGGKNLVTLTERPSNPRREMVMEDVTELVERIYEFGIGGINEADDPYYAASQYQPTGEKRPVLVGKGLARGPLPSGQLWQNCIVRGCRVQPVCLDCLRCEKHCECGE